MRKRARPNLSRSLLEDNPREHRWWFTIRLPSTTHIVSRSRPAHKQVVEGDSDDDDDDIVEEDEEEEDDYVAPAVTPKCVFLSDVSGNH